MRQPARAGALVTGNTAGGGVWKTKGVTAQLDPASGGSSWVLAGQCRSSIWTARHVHGGAITTKGCSSFANISQQPVAIEQARSTVPAAAV